MRLRFKARRFSGNEPLVFKNPYGQPVYLKNLGDITEELDSGYAHKLLSAYGDLLEIIEAPSATVYENKAVESKPFKLKQRAVEPLQAVDPVPTL